MTVGLIYMAVSGSLLILFGVLFHAETVRGNRMILGGIRFWLDEAVHKIHYRLTHISIHFGTGAMRMIFHYITYQLLSFVMNGLRLVELYISKLQARNRKVARTVRAEQTKTHLDLMSEHKEKSALTEAQKRKLKTKAIEG